MKPKCLSSHECLLRGPKGELPEDIFLRINKRQCIGIFSRRNKNAIFKDICFNKNIKDFYRILFLRSY